jgi:hypothetical protein
MNLLIGLAIGVGIAIIAFAIIIAAWHMYIMINKDHE